MLALCLQAFVIVRGLSCTNVGQNPDIKHIGITRIQWHCQKTLSLGPEVSCNVSFFCAIVVPSPIYANNITLSQKQTMPSVSICQFLGEFEGFGLGLWSEPSDSKASQQAFLIRPVQTVRLFWNLQPLLLRKCCCASPAQHQHRGTVALRYLKCLKMTSNSHGYFIIALHSPTNIVGSYWHRTLRRHISHGIQWQKIAYSKNPSRASPSWIAAWHTKPPSLRKRPWKSYDWIMNYETMTVHKAHQQMKSAWSHLSILLANLTRLPSHMVLLKDKFLVFSMTWQNATASARKQQHTNHFNFTPSSTTREPPNTRNKQEKCNKFHILYTYMIIPYISKLWPYNAMICYTHLCILGMLQRARLSRCTNRQIFPTCWQTLGGALDITTRLFSESIRASNLAF